MSLLQALFLAVVEGLTEFLPVSSTGHMIIVSHFFGIEDQGFVKAYTVIVQLGAILAVVWLYRQKFLSVSAKFYTMLLAACVPAGILGLLFEKAIDRALGSVHVVIATLFVGGVVLYFIEQLAKPKQKLKLEQLSVKDSVKVGLFQAIALLPGISRSGATIVGGILNGFTRAEAAQFSFLISVPIMFGATALKAYKSREFLVGDNLQILLLGLVVAFVVALVVIKGFIHYLQKHSLKAFGVYRIVLAVVLLAIELAR